MGWLMEKKYIVVYRGAGSPLMGWTPIEDSPYFVKEAEARARFDVLWDAGLRGVPVDDFVPAYVGIFEKGNLNPEGLMKVVFIDREGSGPQGPWATPNLAMLN